ncbi:MAG: efflux RND transporter periplasmic adaptor subunit [Myxococcota bacterium]|jgi:Cu(I)/Ag(I) efflux system membrane fusion protein/cobalt-zinc-cadmium efflux system membrane fusion protein|nr:efflux RND transporter periplasmic adaptor subunit [Myxococcota bacterium]
MKKLLTIVVVAFFAVLFFHNADFMNRFLPEVHAQNANDADQWACPMHPEAVQSAKGTCPLCEITCGANQSEADQWTCPMHPEVVQSQKGTCSICGMNLLKKAPEPPTKVPTEATPKREIKYWEAPSEPEQHFDKPGKSVKGISLVPVYGDVKGGRDASIRIDPVVVQNMGVRTALVQRSHLSRSVRTVGSVVVAEDQLSVVNLRFSGWVERIHVDKIGTQVKEGQPLLDVYSPELVAAQDEFLLALRTSGKESILTKSARRKLHYVGVPEWQIARMEKERRARSKLTIVAPRNGFVLHKNVVAGSRVNAGQDVYRIANLAHVWVETEVYEFDAPWVHIGNAASLEFAYQRGQRFDSQVAFIQPTLHPQTRTMQIRIELDNTSFQLKPGMFATVVIEASRREDRLVVPTEAIIHSGIRQIVFVVLDLGHYEAREINIGLVGDNHMSEVISGLQEGERVVTSGQFLLDSESQLREAVQKMLAIGLEGRQKHGPRIEAAQTNEKNKGTHEHHEHVETYWTCSMHPTIVQETPGTCPACGMNLVEKER